MRCARPGRSSSASRAPGRPSGSGWPTVCAIAAARSRTSCCRRARPPSGSTSWRPRPASWRRMRVERSEPLVAIGGGALGDTAGFLAAVYLRGVRIIQVPTTLVAQIDSAIGGKTGVDLPEGKNLVGAFHQPDAIVIDIDDAADTPRAPDAGRARRGGQDGGARRRAAVRAARVRWRRRSRGAIRRSSRRGCSPSWSSAPAGPRSRWSSPTNASAVPPAAGSR